MEKQNYKEDEEKEGVKRRGGGKMLGFYHSLFFSVCASELFTNQTPSRPTQMKILQNVRELFICLFVSLCLHFATWNDFTWFANTVLKCGWVKAVTNQHLRSHFVIVNCVLCECYYCRHEQFVHWRTFGSDYLDAGKDSTSKKINQLMPLFIQRSGKPSRRIAAPYRGKKALFHTGMRKVLLGAVDRHP